MERESKIVPVDKQATEYLANERTFLAWIRTSVAIISLGFVVAKFRVWLDEATKMADASDTSTKLGESFQIGLGMMALGGLLALLAAWRYHAVNLQIERGRVTADRGLVIFVSILVVALSAIMIITMLSGVRK